ncbi:MAG: protein kinase [Polyangiales bacterium]
MIALEPGALFADRYRLIRHLGRGGMGAVWEVDDEQVGERVALKLLLVDDVSPEGLDRFRREVRLARKVAHPNVVRLHDLGRHERQWFLSMELVVGRDLRGVLRDEGPLAPATAIRIAREVALALGAVHAQGVVHRDLKPANVIVASDDRILLTDFGVARLAADAVRSRSGMVGTPVYMAPEQVLGAPVDGRADLYALGLMLFEMLTGRVPFVAETAIATALARLQREAPDPRTFEPRIPDDVAELVRSLLTREPETRPGDANVLAETLETLAETAPRDAPRRVSAMPTAPTLRLGARRHERTLAVLPFVYRGPSDDAYLADALAEELVDILSRTQGLRMLALGATRPFHDSRDPRVIGAELDCDAVVDGTLQRAGDRVRIAVRLVDARTGEQMWNERIDGTLLDAFEVQDKVARRVAEALRVGLTTQSYRGSAPQEAIEAYLRARARLQELQFRGAGGAVTLLEDAIELAPDFAPALSAHALASVRAWFLPGVEEGRDWEAVARSSIARANERAGALAETHLAAASLAVQDGDYGAAMVALRRALAIAPTFAEAHEYLGRLLLEADRGEEGASHLRHALELDPSLARAFAELARHHALEGRWPAFDAAVKELATRLGEDAAATLQTRMRGAAWRRDDEALDAIAERLGDATGDRAMMSRYVRGMRDPVLGAQMAKAFLALADEGNRRFSAFAAQLAAELAVAADPELACEAISFAASGSLLDLAWLRRCPLLDVVRETDSLRAATATVAARAALG